MKLCLTNFRPNVPKRELYKDNVDYDQLEFDVSPEEALSFFDRLADERDDFSIESLSCSKRGNELWIEVTSSEFWAISTVDRSEALSIFEVIFRNGRFGRFLPGTQNDWLAYAHLGGPQA